jgi:hypothetical protein
MIRAAIWAILIVYWAVLFVCVATIAHAATVTAPQGAKPASFPYGPMLTAAVAPFTCAATKGGVYVDTSCAQVCVCVTADAKWARSDTGAEGSATDCC